MLAVLTSCRTGAGRVDCVACKVLAGGVDGLMLAKLIACRTGNSEVDCVACKRAGLQSACPSTKQQEVVVVPS